MITNDRVLITIYHWTRDGIRCKPDACNLKKFKFDLCSFTRKPDDRTFHQICAKRGHIHTRDRWRASGPIKIKRIEIIVDDVNL